MTNAIDSKIARILAIMPKEKMINVMERYQHDFFDDSNYWNMLGTAWKAGGCFKDQPRWIKLFQSQRRNKNKIMKSSERREFNHLPNIVTAWRAYADESEIEHSICWSTDQKFVEQYAKAKGGLNIAKRSFKKADIFAFFNRRNESEILVWRKQDDSTES